MLPKKSTSYLCLTLLVSGLVSGILASTATAQTIESSSETLEVKADTSTVENDLPATEASEETEKLEVETNTTTFEVKNTLPPITNPKKLADVELPPRTLNEFGKISPEVNVEPAQNPSLSSQETAQTTATPTESTVKILPRVGVNFTSGSGVGYSSSFTSLEGFLPLSSGTTNNLPFLEGRVLLSTENALLSSNLVLGYRTYNPKDNRILGGYVAYNTRDTGNSNFNQLGVGVESLGDWDVRANAYIPVGDTRQKTQETISNNNLSLSEPVFQGNFLAQTRTQQGQINRRFEAAMAGFDVEAGTKIARIGKTGELRGYAGLYYYDAPGSADILGFSTRLEARPTDNLRLGVSLSNDATYGTNLVLSVGANFPGTRPRNIGKENTVLARLGESVARNVNIVVDEQQEVESFTRQETVFVTNPNTGQPWRFQHVNLGIGTGNGTFESPTGDVASALAVAQPEDIVYVQPGTNPSIPAFQIPDRVQVLSTGPVQLINTVEGNLQLPSSAAGVRPQVTGTVTIGNRTTLSGFEIATTTGAGIAGTNISDVTIRENAIASSVSEGILLQNVTGQVAIANNTINNSGLEGFSLRNNQGQVTLLLTENSIANNGAAADDGDGVNVELSNSATGTFNIEKNAIANNSSNSGIADGIEIRIFDNASGTFNVSNNQISRNQFKGINIQLDSTSAGTFNITNNSIQENLDDGITLQLNDQATGTFNISNNPEISQNGLFGIAILLSDSTSGTFNITSNTIQENQNNGVNIQLNDTAAGTINVSNNQQIARNGLNGIFTTTNETSQLRLTIDSNQISDNSFTSLSINSFDSSNTFASVALNTLTGGSLGDLEVIASGVDDTICLRSRQNTIGNLLLDDSLGGTIQAEDGISTNNIATSNVTNWSGTNVAAGSCGFP